MRAGEGVATTNEVATASEVRVTRNEVVSVPHTPGPWFVARDENEAEYWWSRGGVTEPECVVIGNVDRPICATNDDGIATVEDVANARLISAAPDLLTALKVVTELLETQRDYVLNNGYPEEYAAVDAAKAAIAKAEGR